MLGRSQTAVAMILRRWPHGFDRHSSMQIRIAGIPELVRPGQDGWLVPAGNIQALTDAMRDCLEATADQISRMGESARERVLQRHNVNAEADTLRRLFIHSRKSAADTSPS